MESYKNILLAVDFFEQHNIVVDKAKSIANKYQAAISLVHVIDNLPPITDTNYGTAMSYEMDLTASLMENAKNKVLKLASELNITEQNTYVEIGSPKSEIIRIAKDIQADLIVLGSHGRHGFALLLGSTSNGVLHHATCDVLAVRLSDD